MPQEDVLEPWDLYSLQGIALDVARSFGNESSQSRERMKRFVNRAGIYIAGHDRKWTWMRVVDSFETATSVEEYSIPGIRELQMFWIQDSPRQKLDRVPQRFFRQRIPEPQIATGIPRLYDKVGVDSSGDDVYSFYPIPSGVIEIFYAYFRDIDPMKHDHDTIMAYWGMPKSMREVLFQTAKAFAFDGVDSARYEKELAIADAMIEDAYGADQNNADTTVRASEQDPNTFLYDGPGLPSNYDIGGM